MSKYPGLLIRGGTLVTHEMMFKADILTCGEKIQAVGDNLPAPKGVRIVEADGLLVLPGIIDAHVHIQLDTGVFRAADGWLQGSKSAAFGGVTYCCGLCYPVFGSKFCTSFGESPGRGTILSH